MIGAILISGCATLVKGDKSNVYLMNAPRGIRVYDGSQEIPVSLMEAPELYSFGDSFSDEMNSTRTQHYAPGFTLKCNETYALTLISGGKQSDVVLRPSMAMKWFWLDLFVGGWIIDGVTGNWNELAPEGGEKNVIDVSHYIK
ncbi:hypothetical protein MASR2M18_02120 [Ignavibacteria bacterium]